MNSARRFQAALAPLLFACLALLLIANVLRQASPLTVFPSLDSGYYLYIGQHILKGQIPYLDLWESKPPGIFYINALGLWLGHGTRWGVWALEFGALALAAGLGFVAMKKAWGFFPAVFGTLVWLWGLTGVIDGGNLTEEYSLPINFLAILVFWWSLHAPHKRRYPLLLGLTFAASFLFRANNTGVQIAMVLAWIMESVFSRAFRPLFFRLFWSGLGVISLLGVSAIFLAWQGNLRQMLDAALVFNFSVASGKADFIASLTTGFGFIGIPAGFALLGYLLLTAGGLAKNRPWGLFLLLNWPLEIILSGLSARGYHHYFMLWLPTIGLLSAFLLAGLTDLAAFVERHKMPVLAVSLLLGLLILQPGLADYRAVFQRLAYERQKGIELDHPVAAWLRANTQPGDKVLVWGARLAFNVMARRDSPSAILFYPLLVNSPVSPGLADRFYADLQRNKPAVIVDTYAINQDLLPALDPAIRREQQKSGQLWPSLPTNIDSVYAFIADNYRLETTIGGYQIYRLVKQ
jgi:hypothetical protein